MLDRQSKTMWEINKEMRELRKSYQKETATI